MKKLDTYLQSAQVISFVLVMILMATMLLTACLGGSDTNPNPRTPCGETTAGICLKKAGHGPSVNVEPRIETNNLLKIKP